MNIDRFARHLLSSVCFAPEGGGGGGGGGDANANANANGNANANNNGGGADWYASMDLDPETKAFIAERKYPDVKTALSSAREGHRLASSRNVMERPTAGKEADWKGWEDLGWKAKPDEYQLKAPDEKKAKELGFEYDSDLWGKMRESAHKNRVPLAAAQALHDDMLEVVKARVGETRAKGAKASADLEAELRSEWGGDFARNKELAKRAAAALGVGMDDQKQLEQIIGTPGLAKLFANIGQKLGEDNLRLPGGGGGDLPASVEGIRAEINRFKQDQVKSVAFKDARHPSHADVSAEWGKLTERLAKAEQQAAGARR